MQQETAAIGAACVAVPDGGTSDLTPLSTVATVFANTASSVAAQIAQLDATHVLPSTSLPMTTAWSVEMQYAQHAPLEALAE